MKTSFFTTLLSFSLIFSYAQQVTFEKKYGGWNDDIGQSIIKLSDGYLLAGYTGSFGSGGYDVYAIKIDLSGIVVWQKSYGGPFHDYCYKAIQTSDGGFAFFGWTEEVINGMSGLMIVKTDSTGDEQWRKTYGGASGGSGGVETIDGGYLITGHTTVPNIDIYLAKSDSAGNLLWAKTIGGSYQQHTPLDVIELPQSDLLIVGYTKICFSCYSDAFTLITNYTGDSLLFISYPNNNGGESTFYGVEIIHDEILVAGYNNSFVAGDYNLFLLKHDILGNLLWSKLIPSPMGHIYIPHDIKEGFDGNYIVCGQDAENCFIGKIDTSGNLIWGTQYGFPIHYDLLRSISATNDGGIIVLGTAYDSNFPYNEFYVVKTDSAGTVTSVLELNNNKKILVFPNPGLLGEEVNLITESEIFIEDIKIYDFNGREVDFSLSKAGNNIKVKNLLPGNFLLKAIDKNGKLVLYTKLLILKP